MRTTGMIKNNARVSGNWSRIETHSSFETEDLDQSKFVLNRITSTSSVRKFLFKLKRTLILDPVKNFMFTITMGFLSNVFVMISLIIVYERVSHHFLRISLAFRELAYLLSHYDTANHINGTPLGCRNCFVNDFSKRVNFPRYFRLASRVTWIYIVVFYLVCLHTFELYLAFFLS
jgi:hypothetical protein